MGSFIRTRAFTCSLISRIVDRMTDYDCEMPSQLLRVKRAEQLSLAVLNSPPVRVSWHQTAVMCFVLQTVPLTFAHLKSCHSTQGVIREDFSGESLYLCLVDEQFRETQCDGGRSDFTDLSSGLGETVWGGESSKHAEINSVTIHLRKCKSSEQDDCKK